MPPRNVFEDYKDSDHLLTYEFKFSQRRRDYRFVGVNFLTTYQPRDRVFKLCSWCAQPPYKSDFEAWGSFGHSHLSNLVCPSIFYGILSVFIDSYKTFGANFHPTMCECFDDVFIIINGQVLVFVLLFLLYLGNVFQPSTMAETQWLQQDGQYK